MKKVIAQIIETKTPNAHLLCRRDVIQDMVRELDETWTRKTLRDLRRKSKCNHGEEHTADIVEAYSPPRITAAAKRLGMKASFALDMTTTDERGIPWDFTQHHIRHKALGLLDHVKPWMLMLSPPCVAFSTLQNFNYTKIPVDEVRQKPEHGIMHFAFATLLCRRQAQAGRYFAMEHPASATSWTTQLANALGRVPNARAVQFDFCMLGMA